MTFKKTESKTKNDTKWIATNVRILQYPVSVFLASTKKKSDKAIIKHLTEIYNYFRVTPKKYGIWLK